MIEGIIDIVRAPILTRLRGCVRLEDVSYADAPARLVANASVDGSDPPNLTFRIVCAGNLDPDCDYAISTRLEGQAAPGRKVILSNAAHHPWRPGMRSMRLTAMPENEPPSEGDA